jgi:hypothetical protein
MLEFWVSKRNGGLGKKMATKTAIGKSRKPGYKKTDKQVIVTTLEMMINIVSDGLIGEFRIGKLVGPWGMDEFEVRRALSFYHRNCAAYDKSLLNAVEAELRRSGQDNRAKLVCSFVNPDSCVIVLWKHGGGLLYLDATVLPKLDGANVETIATFKGEVSHEVYCVKLPRRKGIFDRARKIYHDLFPMNTPE